MHDGLTAVLVLIGVVVLMSGVEIYLLMNRRAIERKQVYLWTETHDRIMEQVRDPARIASLAEVRSRLGAQQQYLNMICRVTAAALDCPRSVITMIDSETQTFLAHHEVDEVSEDYSDTAIPLESTYCQFTVASDRTLAIENASRDPLVRDNPCTTVLGMRAYLGTPVYSKEGFPVGSLCVFGFTPRKWSHRDITVIESLASLVAL